MSEMLKLRDDTVQDIQLELIRRTSFNAMDGEKIYVSLMAHRDLREAVLLDRPGVANYDRPTDLLMQGLIKLPTRSAFSASVAIHTSISCVLRRNP